MSPAVSPSAATGKTTVGKRPGPNCRSASAGSPPGSAERPSPPFGVQQPAADDAPTQELLRVVSDDDAGVLIATYRVGVESSSRSAGAVNLRDKLATFDEHWSPRTVALFNGHDVMVVKVQGEFVWHHHDDTDDLFLVLSGRLTIRLPDRDVVLDPGELFVVPVGIEHQPFAEVETELLLIEPSGTPNTGDAATAANRITI